jgi:hypothetical protein
VLRRTFGLPEGEAAGVETYLNLIDHLTVNYGTDPRVAKIVESVN